MNPVINGVRITSHRRAALQRIADATLATCRVDETGRALILDVDEGTLVALERAGVARVEAAGRPATLLAVATDAGRRLLEADRPDYRVEARWALRASFTSSEASSLVEAFDDRGARPRVLCDVLRALPSLFRGRPDEETIVRVWGQGFAVVLGPWDEVPTVLVHAEVVPRPPTRLYTVLLQVLPDPRELRRMTLPTPARWRYAVAVRDGERAYVVDYAPHSRDADDAAIAVHPRTNVGYQASTPRTTNASSDGEKAQ